MKHSIRTAGVVGGLAAITLFLSVLGGDMAVSAQSQQTAQVQSAILATRVETTGTIAPEATISLSFGVGGVVKEVLVDVGDTVKAGDTLAQLNTADLENQIEVQQQNLLMKQASYDQLVAEPTAQEIAQAQANLVSAQSQQTQAQNNLESASNNATINCSSLESAIRTLETAQQDYTDYVNDGYQMDADFLPDTDSDVSEALTEAQNSLNVAEAQCNETTPTQQYEIQVMAAEASVTQAQAALDALIAGPTLEDTASAEAQVTQAELQLADAQAALEDAVIVAARDGVISDISVISGQFINAGANAITLVDNSQLHIDVTVDELDIAQVVEGQQVEISTEALNGITLAGTVARIAPTANTIDGVVTYDVRVNLTNPENAPIRIGMTTDVEILVGDANTVMAVPTEAIQRNGANEFVEVQNADGTTVQVSVTTGQTSDGLTEVSGDLNVGATVIIPAAASAGGGAGPFGGS